MIFTLADIQISTENINQHSILIAAVGYIIVFSALVALYFVFHNLPKIIHLKIRKRFREEGKEMPDEASLSVSGEVSAAITMALYLHMNDFHDNESNMITIKRASKNYSPWSSKIYSMRTRPSDLH